MDADTQTVDSSTTATSTPEVDANKVDQSNVPQARFEEVYRKQKEAERALEAQKAEAERVQKELEELKNQAASKPAETPLTLESFDYDQTALDAAIMEKKIRNETQKAVEKMRKELEEQSKAEAQKIKEQQQLAEYGKKSAAYAAQNPKYQQDIEQHKDVRLTQVLEQAILSSNSGPQIEHFLLTNAAERQRIMSLPALEQAVEFGKIEAGINNVDKKLMTSAPSPVTPISPGASQGLSPYNENMSQADYRKSRGLD